MKTLVKSSDFFEFQKPISFKRELLFFDNIAYDVGTYKSFIKKPTTEIIRQNIDEINFLIEKRLIDTITIEEVRSINENDLMQTGLNLLELGTKELKEIDPISKALVSEASNILKGVKNNTRNIKELELAFNRITRLNERIFASIYNVWKGGSYYSIISNSLVVEDNSSIKKQEVLKFLFSQIPTPDENLPWEAIIDYKSDVEVKRKYYALIDWANEVTNSNMSISEIQDKYNYLLSEYVAQLNLHKLKTQKTNFEIVVNTGAEVIENLCTLKFSEITKSLFSIGKARLDLLEAETKIIGRELAYIYDVNQKFK